MINFVILSQQRSGSHMLMNLLNSHPDICCNSDSQTADIKEFGEDWAYDVGFKSPEGVKAVGFLLKIKTDLHKTIASRENLKTIYLVRKNRLEIFLSKKMAKLYGCYEKEDSGITLNNASKARSSTDPISIAITEFENFDNKWDVKHKEVRRSLVDTDYILVFYEALCADPDRELYKICEYLGLPKFDPKFTSGRGSEKLDKRPIDEAIKNYHELKSYYKSGPRRRYFERK